MPPLPPVRPSPFTFDPAPDRRTEPRLGAEVLGLDVEARLTVGVHVRVVNLSRGGALLEQPEWLRPGTRTELRLVRHTHGDDGEQLAAPCVVTRCWVYRLSPLRYRTALVFTGSRPMTPGLVEIEHGDGPATTGA